MEAELRALREELSNRSSLASNTSSQATTLKEKEEANSLPESDKQTASEDNGAQNETDPEPPQAKKAKKENEENGQQSSAELKDKKIEAKSDNEAAGGGGGPAEEDAKT